MSEARTVILQRYFQALTDGDTDTILSLFAPSGEVMSPFLGVMAAAPFFAKLAEASNGSVLTVLDILHSSIGKTAAARFRYDWTLKDGSAVHFEGVDHFTFDAEDRITRMNIYYDTHPLRVEVGDKYA
ncbi:nuclear transport factor 2 family protein [Shimia abyssi]|uniref:Ketosteroid isomerase-like protein n=1 Tax=Shimia abyssi TaxID=1662395 RepID=A0A2P8FJG7_9RHOB|nr:nuclear transport factor 2 family protein [Shimia abyssi]PSL21886.1 ketosteroid isomerase-like protein [Shimia abyssi]